MSANAAHDGIGQGFLGHLVARTQRPGTIAQTPVLERRRPGIFEPRAPASTTTFDIVDAAVAPDAALLIPATVAAPQSPLHVPPLSAMSAATTSAPTGAAVTTAHPKVSQTWILAAPRAALIAAPNQMPASTTAHLRRGTPSVRSPSPRDITLGETAAPRPASRVVIAPAPELAPTTALPSVTLPQPITMRSAPTARVEQLRFESRTTVVDHTVEKYRDPPTRSTPSATLKLPPRLTNSEAPRTPIAHPTRGAAMLVAPAPVALAPVQVSIGRVEIRAITATPPPPVPRSASSKPQLGLDEYLQQRHGNGR